jgi:quercetin dioxygenase-like cupin family protein
MNNTQIATLSNAAAIAASQPFIARAANAPFLQGPGEKVTFLLSADKTEGKIAAGTIVVDVNSGPPPHVHSDAEELFLIQSGSFEVLANGGLVEARAGDVVYLARGEAHRFRGLDSGETNCFTIINAPGNFEYFMNRWVTLFDKGAPDIEQAIALCGEYNISLFPSDDLAPPVHARPQTRVIAANSAPSALSVLGTKVTILLKAEETEGRYSLVRVEGPRDSGPPPHVHQLEDEMFIVEAGRVEFLLSDETVVAGKGDMVWAPAGHAHTFRLLSDDARMAIFMTPGGFEGFFEECALAEVTEGLQPATILALGERYGMTFPGITA